MTFRDRIDAGIQLSQRLEKYKSEQDVVILGLARGGVPVAHVIAERIHLPMDIIITRKIGHPYNDEFALGAITEYDTSAFGEDAIDVEPEWIEKEIKREKKEMKRREKIYVGSKKRLELTGKRVIIVDDGAATGMTLIAALKGVKKMSAKEIIVAIPIIPASTLRNVEKYANEIIALNTPPDESFYGSVGAYYENFTQVDDEDVQKMLKK